METVTINGEEYVKKSSIPVMPTLEGKSYVIVRCRDAGVHAGYLNAEQSDERHIVLENSRRLWRWWSSFTLSALAIKGVLKGKEDECRFACVLPKLMLRFDDHCEIIECTKEARISIQSVKEHSNE